MHKIMKEAWAVSINEGKNNGERTVIAIFSAEHNARFYIEKTYKNYSYVKPEYHKVRCEYEEYPV